MDANADNAAEEIHSHPPPEVSVTRHSPTESVVQALVADQSVFKTFARKFSNIDFFLRISPLKDDEFVMSEM